MYKDKDKQREANRQASQRRRDKINKAMGMTNQGMTAVNEQTHVIPNKLTIQTLEKSERGEELTEFDNVEALLDDLHDTSPKRGYIGAVSETPDTTSPKPQSHNPMMVGYVPPQD